MQTYKRVLTIAGSDSGGGAGIQADIKAISACGCYAASAITAVTVQNTLGVQDVVALPVSAIQGQIAAVLDDIGADAVKIGMLHNADVMRAVAELLAHYSCNNIVVDPVMVSTSGHRLMEENAISTLQQTLLPMARVITPNIPEAEILLDKSLDQANLPDAAKELGLRYGVSVLLKAGHVQQEQIADILYDVSDGSLHPFPALRVNTRNTHGTGCTLSSALAAYLAHGLPLPEATQAAKAYINGAIIAGADYQIGHGFGPVAHFYQFWK
ncbi:MAG: bifunctional hydroxymethylpyrimidine kinase/phosphomethylpyrimidine kinase [Paludibacteraceae bacterium]|nr:bifunctional hydroxymethylpyrimidine kinase/phosphomethylpyrimidine kinase [Paludibacteraceae bacterium]